MKFNQHPFISKLASFLIIDATKPLQNTKIFWLAILVPALVAIIFSFPITRGLHFDFSSAGYQYFLDKFKFPIWISSLSLVLGVMVGRFHGSAQRAATLIATIEQNNFANYLNHRDHFQKYMQNVADEFDIKLDAFKMYGILFSESSPTNVTISLSDGISDFVSACFEENFFSKMKFASETGGGLFQQLEVNIYFPRFARAIGINAEKLTISDYSTLKKTLENIRKIYRRAMEYGYTRSNLYSNIETEESGISVMIGDFDLWAAENFFKERWVS